MEKEQWYARTGFMSPADEQVLASECADLGAKYWSRRPFAAANNLSLRSRCGAHLNFSS